MMTTYYRDKSVHVTSVAIQVDGRSYPLPELARIWHRRGGRSWRAAAGRLALLTTVGVPLLVTAAYLVIALRWQTSAVIRLAVLAAAVLLGLLTVVLLDYVLELLDRSYARGSHEYEIWAEPGGPSPRGAPVRLLHTNDAIRFGKVYHALQQAVDEDSPRRPALPAAHTPSAADPRH
jgi:hypothetical protein